MTQYCTPSGKGKIQEAFGQAADKYSMVLFTGGDQLEDTSIEDFLGENLDLQELVARCNGQYHVFNNKKKDQAEVTELLMKIGSIIQKNGGSHYTNEMFQEAEREIEEEKQRVLKEKEEQIRRERDELEKKIQEKYEKEMKKITEQFQNEIERSNMMRRLEEQRQREAAESQRRLLEDQLQKARRRPEQSPKGRRRCLTM